MNTTSSSSFGKISALLLSAALSVFCAYAQEEPGAAADADIPALARDETAENALFDTSAQLFETGADAQNLLADFLARRGWNDGLNVKANGERFFVSVGIGPISAPPSSRSYNAARVNAFNKALLDAKAKMAEFLSQEIASSAAFLYNERAGTAPISPEAALRTALLDAEAKDSLLYKLILLIDKKLDDALKAEGYDAAAAREKSAAEAERLRKRADALLATETFIREIRSGAALAVSGLQAFCTVETQHGDNGEVGVVAIWSPKLERTARAFASGKAVPVKAQGKKPIREQLPAEPEKLLPMFGVYQKIDENGDCVLVSFGQASAISSTSASQRAAYDKARLNAQAQIREFAGTAVEVARIEQSAETSRSFAGEDVPEYTDFSRFEQFQRSVAEKMVCRGISTIKTWKARHPVSGEFVYGAICAWSPAQADAARSMKDSGTFKNAESPSSRSDRSIGFGEAGDEDAF